MEPISLTAVVIAISTIFFTKVIEKPGEDLGKFLSNKAEFLIYKLSSKSNKIKGILEAEKPGTLQIGEAILESKEIAEEDPEIAKAILEIETAAKDESNQEFKDLINQVRQEVKHLLDKHPTVQNMTKLSEKIAFVNQGYIANQHNTYHL